jgi:hypothetical protein
MATFNEKLTHHWRDAATLLLGVWLAISPWALGYMAEATAAWNAYIVGIVIAVAAAAAIMAFQQWEEWVNVALAVWLIVSPFVLGYAALETVLWNQIVVGVLVGGLALWTVVSEHKGGVAA